MAENYILGEKKKTSSNWLIKVLLLVSFIWTSLYSATSVLVTDFYWNFGNLLDVQSANFSTAIIMVISEALFCWISFEITFWLYRFVLQFKIYSFIVPTDNLKNESRTFYIYRNVFYGLFLNLCFLFPYLYEFAPLMSLVTTFVMLIIYSVHLNKTYAEPIIGHFVFKNFCYPIFIYQAIILIIEIIGVL